MGIEVRGRHTLADFLNDTFALVPRIWKRALPVSAVVLLPGAAIWAAAVASLAGFVSKVSEKGESFGKDPSGILASFGPFLWLCGLASACLFLGSSFQKAYVCAEANAAIEGRKPPFRKLLLGVARRPFLRVTVQDAAIAALETALALIAALAVFLPFLIGMIGELAEIGKKDGPGFGFVALFILLYLVAILAAAAAIWWLRVKTAVCAPASVCEGVNALAGMGRSVDLVRGRGWRVFGEMFVVSLVISFGLGILTGPVTFAVILPGYFSILKESIAGAEPSPASIAAFLSSLSWAMGVAMLISGIVEGCLWPSFLSLLHADLRARAGETRGFDGRRGVLGGRVLRGSRRRRLVELDA